MVKNVAKMWSVFARELSKDQTKIWKARDAGKPISKSEEKKMLRKALDKALKQ